MSYPITTSQLRAAVPGVDAVTWHPFLLDATRIAGIKTPQQMAMFLAQTGHESQGWTRLEESLNYTPDGILRTWPRRFSPGEAREWGRTEHKKADQRAIANHAYNGRYGNRPGTNDGWNYRGRGLIQCTFFDNYAQMSVDMFGTFETLTQDPDLLTQPQHAMSSAAYYWRNKRLSGVPHVAGATLIINGGDIGLADRVQRYSLALRVLQ
jgi:putative chitinase